MAILNEGYIERNGLGMEPGTDPSEEKRYKTIVSGFSNLSCPYLEEQGSAENCRENCPHYCSSECPCGEDF